jgi:hypothetical protein
METTKHERKKELHDRVQERCIKLKMTLLGLQADPAGTRSERRRAIEKALAAWETHLSGGWDAIDETELVALTHWLDSSRSLFDENFTLGATSVLEQGEQS